MSLTKIVGQTITFLLALSLIGTPIQRGYRGVVPLESTRKDVEKLLGKPTDRYHEIYYFRNEIVSFAYAKYGCTPPPRVEGWPIPPLEG
jgi:hypothetical protein